MDVSDGDQKRALERARELVKEQVDWRIQPYDRLWQAARRLNVSRIEPGATRSQGFVKRLEDGSFGIYYSKDFPIVRRRYTVAHELAHLVLEQFVPHITPNNTVARGGTRNTQIERVVDRVASEILMPERLVVAAISEASIRSKSDLGRVGKHRVIADVRHKLGVSESAMAFRLVELPQLSSVIIRVMLDDAPEFLQRRRVITQLSDKATLESQSNVDSIVEEARQLVASGVAHRPATFHTLMKSPVGFREVACDGKLRTIPSRDGRYLEYWIIGWTSNSTEGSEYDDARIIDGNNSTS